MINLEEILVANGTGILILLGTLAFAKRNRAGFDRDIFNAGVIITFAALVAETLSFFLDGFPGSAVHCLQHLLNAYLFLASSTIGVLWVLYVDYRIYHSTKRLRNWFKMLIVPHLGIAALLICDLFGAGFIFSITPDNVYLRGKLIWLPFLVLLLDCGISLLISFRSIRRNHHISFFPIYTFVIPALAGLLIQNRYYGLSLGWLGVSLSLQSVQSYLLTHNSYQDDLSGLYNRKYYDHVVNKLFSDKLSRRISGVMIDIDQFKLTNDTLGHAAGDDAIHTLGMLLSDVITERSIPFRFGGDEFVIISFNMDKDRVAQLIRDITLRLEQFNRTGEKAYKLEVSIGYVLCDTEDLTSEQFLQKMDQRMYAVKATHATEKASQ